MFRTSFQKSDKKNPNRHTLAAMLPQDGMGEDDISLSLDDMHINNNNNRSPSHFPFAKSNIQISPTIYDQAENNFVSPSVRVKHSITYGYDERKFQIFEGEVLFLINKTNQDWWLCLRLDENQTFFVPASYLEELEIGHQPNIVPPPRPPPPPPQGADRTSQSSTKSNAAMTAAAVAAAAATTPASSFSTFTNDYSQLTNKLRNKPEVKARQLLNYSNQVVTNSNNSTFSTDKVNKRSTYYLITNQEDNDSSVNSSSTDNNAMLREKTVPGSMTDDSTDSIINEDYYTEADQVRYEEEPITYTDVENLLKNNEEDNHHYENIPVIRRISNTNLTNRKGVINTSTDNEQQSNEQSPVKIIDSLLANTTALNRQHSEEECPSKNEDDEDDLMMMDIEIPEGWMKHPEKKHFYNKINDEKWFMTYDSNQKPYFYNYEGKSIWKLEELPEREDPHFRKNFDTELGSFPHIIKHSMRQGSSDGASPNSASITTPPKTSSIASNSHKTPQMAAPGLNGHFRVVKITEKGKKCKKKTIENYRIHLASTTLLFISTKNGVEKLDLPIDLKKEGASCCKVEIPRNSNSSSGTSSSCNSKDTNNNPSKNEKIKLQLKFGRKDKDLDEICDFIGMNKCGFVLETSSGYKLLIIHETEYVVNEWVSEINSIISQNGSLGSPEILAQPVSDSRKSFKSPNSKKECVYGANLINLCQRDCRMVPVFVTDIIREIENKGLEMDGIYRISGNLAEVQKVRIQVDQGKNNFKDFDIHVLCGAFKTFFRELEEPLIPENLHESFLYYITVSDLTKRFENIQELIRKMPIAHRETMRVVCEHLLKVVDRSSENRMTVQNVALVFGPNIIRSNPIINSNQGFNPHIMTQNVLVEYILKNFRDLYSFNETQKFYEENY